MKIQNVIIIILFLLYFLNNIYLRTIDQDLLFLNILFGSLPSFIGAYILVFLVFDYTIPRLKLKSRVKALFLLGTITNILLITDEVFPFISGNKVFDIYDLIALILGSLIATLLFVRQHKRVLYG